jgi:class I fructose-bisphosphate aldolase
MARGSRATSFCELFDEPVEQAVRLDAAAVVVNLLLLPDQPELHRQCVQNVARVRAACTRWGMPLMVEPIAMRLPSQGSGGYAVVGDPEKTVPLVRQAVELGADLLKADPTDDPADFARVIVYGRNVIQHPNPTAITRAFMAIVHDGASPEQALALLRA